jgi:UDP-N-acetylmuramate-alanine ligase
VNALYDDFVSCWEDADYVLLSDVYNPQGRDEVSKTKNSKSLAENINKISPGKAIYVGVDKKIPASLNNLPLKKGDVAVLMGAGTINNITPLLLRRSS